MANISKSFQAAVYLRLSREDGDVAEGGKQVSNSIANQKELVMDYLKSHPEITVVSTYVDDGFSGVNFERPEFQRMLSDIKEDKINCVIVKDDCGIIGLNRKNHANTRVRRLSPISLTKRKAKLLTDRFT